MAAGLNLYGGSFGAGSSLFLWATEEANSWFDGWCASRGVDPWELPVYRLINLIWFAFIDGKSYEESEEIRKSLLDIEVISPIEQLKNSYRVPWEKPKPSSTSKSKERQTLGRKTDYVPPWYQGEQQAYANAKVAMKGISGLPKMKT